MKHFMFHCVQTLHASSAKILNAFGSVFHSKIQSSEIKLAYVQSNEPLRRRVLITNPAEEFKLDSSQCFELLKPLSCSCDAGDLWQQSRNRHLTEDLRMMSKKCVSSLYLSFHKFELIGITLSYFDSIILAGTPKFHELDQKTQRNFEKNGDQDLPFPFSGLKISPCYKHAYTIDQKFHIPKLEELNKSITLSEYRSMCMKLLWLASSGPDMQF